MAEKEASKKAAPKAEAPAKKKPEAVPAPAAKKAAPTTGKHAEAKSPAPKAKGPTAPKKVGTPTKKEPAPKGESKPAAKPGEKEEIKIVEEGDAVAKEHIARAKPQLTAEQRASLSLRAAIDRRRPRFRRQQWYEYKRLEDSGWRRPRGQDSAMRRRFGYEQNVVRIGYRGPADVRGLHSSGFEEVRVITLKDLAGIDPKHQAARISAGLGRRKLKIVYEEADKRKIRILNRKAV